MLIEESILINAELESIWNTFTDLTSWAGWNTIARDIKSDSGCIERNGRFQFCIRPYVVPVTVKVTVTEVAAGSKVVWTGAEFGISSRHEFLFQQEAQNVLVTSRETFWGLPLVFAGVTFPKDRIRELTVGMLQDLKNAAEKSNT